MKQSFNKLYRSLILSLLLSFDSQGIVMRHDVKPEQYEVLPSEYPSVIDLRFLTGTLISPQWILTAAHGTSYMPGQQAIRINQQTYHVEFIVNHPEYNQFNLKHDIALLKLDRPVKGVAITNIYTKTDELSKPVWFVGRGDIGNGIIGIVGPATSLNHAQNKVERTDDFWLTFDFDRPEHDAFPLEGISGPGDSGGPAFIKTSSGLKVAGVSSHQRNNSEGEGLYGVEEYYTRTSTHQKWIDSVTNQSAEKLGKIAETRPYYHVQPATKKQQNALVGQYTLTDGSSMFFEPCGKNVCYRWYDSLDPVIIQKTENSRWFAPSINRVFTMQFNDVGKVNRIIMDDFNGQRVLNASDILRVDAEK